MPGDIAFESERLEMRPWEPADVEAFHRIWGDPRVIFWGPSESLDETRQALARVIARCAERSGLGWFAAIERTSGECVGNLALQQAPFDRDVEIGWHFEYRAWGQGYATEAARAGLRYAFEEVGLTRVVAAVLPDNHRSRRVAEKAGLRRIGGVIHAGVPHDLFEVRRPA